MWCQGYLCCKRRVLEFDEFLKIGGCTHGRHLFIHKPNASTVRVNSLLDPLRLS